MRFLRALLDKQAGLFEKGGRLEKLSPLWEMNDTFLFTPGTVTAGALHVRDGLDVKRLMMTVVVALAGCIYMAVYNTGYQANLAIAAGAPALDTWQAATVAALGWSFDPDSWAACIVHGALYYLPVLAVTFAVGGAWEAVFAIVRKHEINEGFLVTGMLFPLILPPTVPLWQVALGISFGVVVGKEIFGGTGMNVLNPALTARAFLFFAYPADMSGDAAWIAAATSSDGVSGATWLARTQEAGAAPLADLDWWDAFVGFVPGSMGETSALACLLGAAVLVIAQVGSWRIMLSVVAGTFLTAWFFNAVGSDTNPAFAVSPGWHFALGGWAFGTVFMATDPVSAPSSDPARYLYGFLIGVLVVLVRVVNPAYPEGMMLAILFMNLFAPVLDHFVVRANVKRRRARYAG
ncbi:MAG: NADH:ubiquinone reductase (Na(+)-transporting) subunit B [Vicinamibacterales bacterium]|jgi:Na+-transporting NADH:ubiquinone oxidoreductase subunit B|nr:NADH:ubiquinone reductase (Na(+)-transporting) subunit B [Acidobacteriota bacterium]MDP6373143.1 NADH:ubiquinone reductase (Na(+)-transporting) subunit B [Vicinamibacterales bacterium]MDP6607891.1 NADH:ubiquinone reductase (Na(+)-transporting) subunit B [Vicinamibacterales bacterium]HAK56466.1 NADH:ubiquinone reductase (Na(+)-transporting) subunit B [Acidobacteriota bacterium]|tara:strand:+ start:4463 stop:5680 length:1218 start_codon:yes stop_codon:yes gene_type:complete